MKSYFHKKYLKFSKELEEYEDFVNSYINSKKYIVDNYIDINKIKKESNFIKRKSVELLIKKIQAKDILDVNDQNMQDIMKLLNSNNKCIDLNNNYQAINSYEKFMIIKKVDNSLKEVIIDKDIELEYFNFFYNSKEKDNTNNCILLDSKEINLPLLLRSRLDGDTMDVKNLGNKKINEIFINSKVPKYKRDNYPLLVDSQGKILWIPGIKKSKFAKDKSEKYDIIIKCEAR